MKYYIIEKKEKLAQGVEIQHEDISFIDNGTIDFHNLRGSRFHKDLLEIPERNQKQLKRKGHTTFTIVRTTVVMLDRRCR